MILNLVKAKENIDVPLKCPAAKKPQQIISAQPKNNKQKVSALEHTKLHILSRNGENHSALAAYIEEEIINIKDLSK